MMPSSPPSCFLFSSMVPSVFFSSLCTLCHLQLSKHHFSQIFSRISQSWFIYIFTAIGDANVAIFCQKRYGRAIFLPAHTHKAFHFSLYSHAELRHAFWYAEQPFFCFLRHIVDFSSAIRLRATGHTTEFAFRAFRIRPRHNRISSGGRRHGLTYRSGDRLSLSATRTEMNTWDELCNNSTSKSLPRARHEFRFPLKWDKMHSRYKKERKQRLLSRFVLLVLLP